jgi:TIR domain
MARSIPRTSNLIFVSYRRADASGEAGRIYDRLIERFGREQIFMDVDSIRLGENFAEAIERAVNVCRVLLAIIGPSWLTATDKEGGRRLESPEDQVRLEIEAALRRGIKVVPIIVRDAVMPRPHDLPESLAELAYQNGQSVRHECFGDDVGRLLDALVEVLAEPLPEPLRLDLRSEQAQELLSRQGLTSESEMNMNMAEPYKPILSRQDRTSSLPARLPRDPRSAWVLVTEGHSLQTRWPWARPSVGALAQSWRSAYKVDITQHSLQRHCELPSRGGVFAFEADVQLICSVKDPALVVAHAIWDVWPPLWLMVNQLMRTISRRFGMEESAKAEVALEHAVENARYDLGVGIDRVVVGIGLDEHARRLLWRLGQDTGPSDPPK